MFHFRSRRRTRARRQLRHQLRPTVLASAARATLDLRPVPRRTRARRLRQQAGLVKLGDGQASARRFRVERTLRKLAVVRSSLAGRRAQRTLSSARAATARRVGGALVGMLVIAGLVGWQTVPAVTVAQQPNTSSNWSGVEVLSPSGMGTARTVTASMVLPPATSWDQKHLATTLEGAFWAGAGGDFSTLATEGPWLPQAGFFVRPEPQANVWWIDPWEIVCHTVGDRAEFPGWVSPMPYVVPAGSRLTVTLSLPRRGSAIVARLTIVPAKVRDPNTDVAYQGPPVTIAKRLRTLPGEPMSYRLVESVLESPGFGPASSWLRVQSPGYHTLPEFGGQVPITLRATYTHGLHGLTVVPTDLTTFHRVSSSLTSIALRSQPNTITVHGTLKTFRNGGMH